MDELFKRIEAEQAAAIERLKAFLAIPSVSTDPEYAGQVTEAAKYVAEQLDAGGLEAKVMVTGGHPIVFARTHDAQVADRGAPRILFYGHYDVQPPDPVEKWDTPAFELVVREGRIYARGACDDKGQVACFLEALRAYHAAGMKLPCHVTVLIEGEEECGSAHLVEFIEEHRDELAADVAVISDTTLWPDAEAPMGGVPAICYALRGLLYFDIQLHGPGRDLHSGVYGGTLANPATVLTGVLGRLFDEKHRVAVPRFYDDVIDAGADEKKQWEKLKFDESVFFDEVGVKQGFGEARYTTLERRWTRPSCDINGLYGGYGGQGAKTVIPAMAGAKVSFRLVANQDPDKVARAFRGWLEAQPVHGLRWKITGHGGSRPAAVATDSPWIAQAGRAIEQAAGRRPVLVREGATIPVVGDLKRMLGVDSLLIGFGLDSDAIHSPNEHFGLDRFALGCRTHVALLGAFAGA